MHTISRVVAGLAALLTLGACSDATGSLPDFLDCNRVQTHRLGDTELGTLTDDDCFLPDDFTLVDYYRLEVSGSETFTLTLRSDDFDPFLFIIDDNGDLVAFDDDGDPGTVLGSRIDITLPRGRYFIGANAVYDDEFGDYTLQSF